MSTPNRIIKNTGFLYVRTLASLLLSVFTTRFLLEGLGVQDYGLYNVVGGAISMLGFINASLSTVTQRFISYAEGEGDKNKIIRIFNNSLLIHNALALISATILLTAGFFFFNGILNIPPGKLWDAIWIYGCLMFSTVFSITVVPYEAEINAHENMLIYAFIGVLDVVLKFLIALCILYLPAEKLITYAILMTVESFSLRLITQLYCKRKYKECRTIAIRKNRDKKLIHEMLSFSGWNLINIGTGMISLYGMNIVANHYFGTSINAAMGIATQLSGVMMGLSANMLKAVTPVIVKSEGGQKHEQMLKYTYASCKFSYLIFAFTCIPVIFYIKPILFLWLTKVPEWTPILCIILIISTLVEQWTVALYHSIMAVGKVKYYNITKSLSNILPLGISILMFEYYNFAPYWVFINWGICKSLIGGIVNIIYSKQLIDLSIEKYCKMVLFPTIICSVISSLIFFILSKINIPWLLSLLMGGVTTIPIYYSLGLNKNERSQASSLIPLIK